MRAMSLDRPASISTAPLRLVEVPEPAPAPGALLVRVTACGVCRTDLQVCEGDVVAPRFPLVPGHQIVGHVVGVGSGLTGWLGSTCGGCASCRSGHENLCERATFTGLDVDGGYADFAQVRGDFAFHLPEGFSDLDAAPLLCGGVIGYRSLRRCGVRPGQRLGLYGFGASASLAIQVARHWGCRVFVATRSVHEQARARSLGAEWAGDYAERPPEPLDAAVSFAPTSQVAVKALEALAPGATLAINAIHLEGDVSFSYDTLWRERGIVSVANFTRRDARELLALAAAVPLVPTAQAFRLEQANEALLALKAGEVHGAAVLTMAEPQVQLR